MKNLKNELPRRKRTKYLNGIIFYSPQVAGNLPLEIKFISIMIILGVLMITRGQNNLDTKNTEVVQVLKASISVGQIKNRTGDINEQLCRMQAENAAQMQNLNLEMFKIQEALVPYQQEYMKWFTEAQEKGFDNVGPPPEFHDISTTFTSPYLSTSADPIAGSLRDMFISALYNSGKFIVVERQAIIDIFQEQRLTILSNNRNDTVKVLGNVEGADLLLTGTLTLLEAEASGADIGVIISEVSDLLGLGRSDNNLNLVQMALYTSKEHLDVSWENAIVRMEIRLIDVETSRVVAATTIEGESTDFNIETETNTDDYSYSTDRLPIEFSVFINTPVEDAFRKMVDATVDYLVEKTPSKYFKTSN